MEDNFSSLSGFVEKMGLRARGLHPHNDLENIRPPPPLTNWNHCFFFKLFFKGIGYSLFTPKLKNLVKNMVSNEQTISILLCIINSGGSFSDTYVLKNWRVMMKIRWRKFYLQREPANSKDSYNNYNQLDNSFLTSVQ